MNHNLIIEEYVNIPDRILRRIDFLYKEKEDKLLKEYLNELLISDRIDRKGFSYEIYTDLFNLYNKLGFEELNK
jgi:hypothetical protein